mgnify:CR=1 FL=1
MAIFVDQNTKVIVQGLTGGQGKYHGLRNKAYGTQIVAGVTPGKGGTDVEGIPVYDSVAEAVKATGATASFVTVPPKAASAAILEAAAAGITFIVCITEGIPVLDMAANTAELGKVLSKRIEPTLADYGLSLPELYIENISLPEDVERALDKRTSMGMAGDLARYAQYSAAEAMTESARNPGSGGGAMGAAVGAMLGAQAATIGAQAGGSLQGPSGARPIPPAPPAPVEHVWHIAAEGQTSGPFSLAAMGRKAADGSLTRDTYVWTAGQDGWKHAGDVGDLARLFTVLPPPPPGA